MSAQREDPNQPYGQNNPYGYQPIPVYDSGGEVNVDNPGVLKKLGKKAEDVVSAVKTIPPNDSEAESLREKQGQIDALSAQRTQGQEQPAMRPIVTTESDLVHPAQYGTRPGSGQVLYKVDRDGNITPILTAPPATQAASAPIKHAPVVQQEQPRMKPIVPESLKTPMPVYDNGGDVSMDAARRAQAAGDSGINSFLSASSSKPMAAASVEDTTGDQGAFGIVGFKKNAKDREAAKEARLTTDRGNNVMHPSYMPKMNLGEDVAAPIYDDGGDVDVNDGKHQVAILQDGERVLTPEENERYKVEHPEVKAAPAAKQPNSEEKAKAKAAEQVQNPGVQTSTAPPDLVSNMLEEKPVEKPEPVEQPKVTGGQQLASQYLKSKGLTSITDLMTKPESLNTPAAQGGASPQAPAAPQPGMKPIVPAPTAEPTAHLSHKERLAKYDAEIQTAMDEGTAAGHNKALLLQEAKQNFLKNTPWGSAENHPGVLGKLGHIGEMVASRTPFFGINAITASIPGSEGYRAAERRNIEAQLPKAQEADVAEQNATTAETSAKNAGTVSQQYAAALRAHADAVASGDQKTIDQTSIAVENAKKAVDESKPVAKIPTGDEPLGEQQEQLQQSLLRRYQVLHPGGALPPEFQMKPNSTANDYTRLDKALESIEKAQGTKTQQDTVAQQKEEAAQVHKEEHAGKNYDTYRGQVDKQSAPMDAITSRASLLIHNLDSKDKQADAQVAPELLSIASGGVGSGLRMNEAEISRVVGGRSVWDSLIAMANKVREGQGTFSDEQRAQMRNIGTYIYDRAAAVTMVYSDVRDKMLEDKDDETQVKKDYNDGKRIADQIIRKGIVPQGGKPKDGDFVFHNGQVLIVKGGKGYPAIQR